MAITLSEKFRGGVGNRKWMFFEATHDESSTTVSASLMDLTYIDYFMCSPTYIASDVANTSALGAMLTLSVNAVHDTLTYGAPYPTGSKTSLLVIGW